MFGLVASTTSCDAVPLDAAEQLVDPQVLGLDAVERRERAAEDVVEPAVLVRALDRDQVGRLLDDADDGVVAARVAADLARLLLGQVPALAAEANALLDLGDRRGERGGLVRRDAQEVEREPLRRSLADAGQARELRDEVVDRGAEHATIVPGGQVVAAERERTRPGSDPWHGPFGRRRASAVNDDEAGDAEAEDDDREQRVRPETETAEHRPGDQAHGIDRRQCDAE